MSTIHEKYDKFILTAGIAGLLGLGYLAYSKISSAEELMHEITYKAPAEKTATIQGLEKIQEVYRGLEGGHIITRPVVGEHKYDLFVGPSLWLKKGDKTPIALYSGDPIHPPVPNSWFIDLGMQSVLKLEDALTGDSDGDGFTNLEEFEADPKTLPNDATSHPNLVTKLFATNVQSKSFWLKLNLPQDGQAGFEALRGRGILWRADAVKVGEKFGQKTAESRFLLESVTQVDVNRNGIQLKDWKAVFKDLKNPDAPALEMMRDAGLFKIEDLTVEFQLNAGKKPGERIKVEVGQKFALPFDAKQPNYQLVSADAKAKTAVIKNLADGAEITIK